MVHLFYFLGEKKCSLKYENTTKDHADANSIQLFELL